MRGKDLPRSSSLSRAFSILTSFSLGKMDPLSIHIYVPTMAFIAAGAVSVQSAFSYQNRHLSDRKMRLTIFHCSP
ncbi:hypothetical protein HZ326_24013 [Fusarium oxysporum f. sp. albedinis]|nr:hypothetical protein HZ326_24013 [Fusarium oxysporum f. sp. albedinis]